MEKINIRNNLASNMLFGLAVGDALGVPVEFKSRDHLVENRVVDMMGYMAWNQPKGTWSDDSSLTFCTAEAILENGFDIPLISKKMAAWLNDGYWGAHYKVFDVGRSTRSSLERILDGESPYNSGDYFPENNGNGSLMRILPLIFIVLEEDSIDDIFNKSKLLSSITHAHFRSWFACFIYIIYAKELYHTKEKFIAYSNLKKSIDNFLLSKQFNPDELILFKRLLNDDISSLEEDDIHSSGYVLHSLEASLWCLLKTETYQEAVLKAVNLGMDTDTTACITGGLAGIYYGVEAIPENWINEIARSNDINELATRLNEKYRY